jgi:hypothetical protein
MRIHIHTSLATAAALVMEKKKKKNKRERKLGKEIYIHTCVDWDPLTRKREYLSILIFFLLLHGFEQQLIEYKISNDRRAKNERSRKEQKKESNMCMCVSLPSRNIPLITIEFS